MSTTCSLVWFVLLDSELGQPYKGTGADKVAVPSTGDIADFRDAVKAKYDQPNYLKDIPSSALLVYRNKASFLKRNASIDDGSAVPLEEDSLIDGLGSSKSEALLVVVPATSTVPTNNVFSASDEQMKKCFHLLEEHSDLKKYCKAFDEKEFFENTRFMHAHRLGQSLPSKAADELRRLLLTETKTVLLIGVSGCGKSHAIYLNALEKMCIYLTPNSWILIDFYIRCRRSRADFDFKDELEFRIEAKDSFVKYLCARYIVLLYLKQECFFSDEYLFFLQSANDLDKYDKIISNYIRETYSDIAEEWFSKFFVAIDEAQIYFTPHYDILYRIGIDCEQRISFARFFSWCAPVIHVKVVISGTALRLRDMDRLGSGNRQLSEYGIVIVHKFNYFSSIHVKNVVSELFDEDVDEDVLERMSNLLQGRPRILMNFVEKCKRQGIKPKEYLEEYIKMMVENGESTVWTLYGLWKALFESDKRSFKVNLRLGEAENGVECDVQTCFLKILVDSIRLLGDADESAGYGSSFYLTSAEFDNISTGICPLLEMEISKYCFLEPLSMMSGIHYVTSSSMLSSQCLVHVRNAMLDKGTTDQNRGSYFDLFVAMKVAVDKTFRRLLFDMAVEIGMCDRRTQWIRNLVLPDEDYFKLKCKLDDDAFLKSLECDGLDVVLPSNLAGPDVKWWIFMFGLKTTWTKSRVGVDESRKNEETITPSLCFYWRDKNKKGVGLKKKRKRLHEQCVDIAERRIKESRGFIRVRIELPYSNFECNTDRPLSNDIHLNMDWKVFRTLLSADEIRHFEVYLKYIES